MDTNPDIFVCYECIGEAFLSKEVYDTNHTVKCDFCDALEPSIELDELAEQIHGVIENYFSKTSDEPEGYEYYLARDGLWERDGYLIEDVICDIASVKSDIGTAVREYLSDCYDAGGKHSLDEEQPYDSNAHYNEKETDALGFVEQWSSFKHTIRSQSRFFNLHAKEVMEQIFRNLDTLVTSNGDSVIKIIPADSPDDALYRARVSLSFNELEHILKALPQSLGAPPAEFAKSGRMNASGISVFYGALDRKTCITEVRAPVGSSVIVGEFQPVRPLNILDLNRLKMIYVTGSYFDPDHLVEQSRAKFLDHLVSELSSPVLPGSEDHDYLPTQVVAEYLAQLDGLGLDGVMFKSTQSTGDGQNIVIFNHASGIVPYELPKGTEVDVSFGNGDPDDYDPTITIFEIVPKIIKDKPFVNNIFSQPRDFTKDLSKNERQETLEPTLRLTLESVTVHEIKGVEYTDNMIEISRHKYDKDNPDDF